RTRDIGADWPESQNCLETQARNANRRALSRPAVPVNPRAGKVFTLSRSAPRTEQGSNCRLGYGRKALGWGQRKWAWGQGVAATRPPTMIRATPRVRIPLDGRSEQISNSWSLSSVNPRVRIGIGEKLGHSLTLIEASFLGSATGESGRSRYLFRDHC